MADHEEDDDLELGELENAAFIPATTDSAANPRHASESLRWVPRRVMVFLENISRLKFMILFLVAFLVLLGLLRAWNGKTFEKVVVPKGSVILAKEMQSKMAAKGVPDFVFEYAPLVLMDKKDPYMPSDMATHISNIHAEVNFSEVSIPESTVLSMSNLDILNDLGGEDVYLTAHPALPTLPEFLLGTKPNPKTLQTENAASAVIIVVDKSAVVGDGVVDVFYMYFYTYNKGPEALGHQVGNHLGDWEHTMLRFVKGEPTAVWFSQHDYGAAYSYTTVLKSRKRPLCFSARGSHANYAFAGTHDLAKATSGIPSNIVFDHTSYGSLWDPTLSAYYYNFSTTTTDPTDTLTPIGNDTPTGYLYFSGKWGDQQLPDSEQYQEDIRGFRKWIGGPQGPLWKHLDRASVCWPSSKKCKVLESLNA